MMVTPEVSRHGSEGGCCSSAGHLQEVSRRVKRRRMKRRRRRRRTSLNYPLTASIAFSYLISRSSLHSSSSRAFALLKSETSSALSHAFHALLTIGPCAVSCHDPVQPLLQTIVVFEPAKSLILFGMQLLVLQPQFSQAQHVDPSMLPMAVGKASEDEI